MTQQMESDQNLFERLAKDAELGHIGLGLADGSPRVIPVDIVYHEEKFYFHGAISGEKYDLFENGTPVNLFIYKEYAVVPGDWLGASGCAANHLFESCSINGRCYLLKEEEEAFTGLLKLVEKFNPDGSDFGDMIRPRMPRTGSFAIAVDNYTTKRNMISNKNEKIRLNVIAKLQARGKELDLVTAEAIKSELS